MAKGRREVYDFDVIVIGSGSGGGVASHILSSAGKKVAIIEQENIGGECPNWGCVPAKALLQAAETYETIKNADQFGIKVGSVNPNYVAIDNWRALAVERTGTGHGKKAFENHGVYVVKGHAHFINKHEVSVGKKRFTAKNFVIATGTHDFIPPIEGIKKSGYLTYRGAMTMKKLPKSIFVIGGGAIGLEFAHYFSTMGSKVTVAEFAPRLLFREDEEVSALTKAMFEAKDVDIMVGTEVVKVENLKTKKIVHYKQGDEVHKISVDEILLAAGKAPNTDVGLENAGVKYNRRGIEVSDTMQTSSKHIYATGDVAGPYAFTHMATYQARIAAHNILHREKIIAKYHAVPRCIFLDPEVAGVGMTEHEVKESGVKYKTSLVPISILGRSNTSNKDTGFVKVIASQKGKILGAAVISPRAGEVMHELALAVNLGLNVSDLANTIHAFPTWSESVRIACARLS